jgi:hypothetical protein
MSEVMTLGPVVTDWIERHCVIPDGEQMGQPFRLTQEMKDFVDAFYAVDLSTRKFVFGRGGQLIRPQKWGKGPFSAALICAEAAGPVLPVFAGGELVGGKAWETPWIQVTAVSEDQTDNVFRALLPMIQLSPALNMEISDTGLTRVNLPGGGYIEPVTASARSRLGQRITFVVQDETHSWVQSNGGLQLADNQRRNLAGMGGRFLETTNAFDPVEASVAQRTFESKVPGTLLDDAEPPPGSVRNKRERRKVLQAVYGDSWWVDLDRIDQEIEALLEHDPAQAERFFLNRKLASEGAAFDVEKFKTLAAPKTVSAFSVITLGIDGARHHDAIAVIATDVKSGYQWPLTIVERPDRAPDDYEHDLDAVDGAVSDAFERYTVWRAYCDPHWIEGLIEGWQNRYGDKRVVQWLTNRPRPVAWAIRNFEQAIAAGDLSHDGDDVFVAHVRNARRRKLTVLDDKERPMHTLSKDSVRSLRKIDAAMAAVLSWEARGDCIAGGGVFMDDIPTAEQRPAPQPWQPGRASVGWLHPQNQVGPMGSMS